MQQRVYTNRPLSLDEQIAMLKSRRLIIDDVSFAKRQLQIISYFLTFSSGYDGGFC